MPVYCDKTNMKKVTEKKLTKKALQHKLEQTKTQLKKAENKARRFEVLATILGIVNQSKDKKISKLSKDLRKYIRILNNTEYEYATVMLRMMENK